MPELTCFRKYGIIYSGLIFTISPFVQISLHLINSEFIIPLILGHLIMVLYGILLPFSVLRIKWIRKTATILGGLFVFGYPAFVIYFGGEELVEKYILINDINLILLIINIFIILHAYWGINICDKNC